MVTGGQAVPTSLFLFAHQDDEFGAFDLIRRAASEGRAICAYFTDGANGATAARRNLESMSVLQRLGVHRDDVHFLGEAHGIPDCRLFEHLEVCAAAFSRLLAQVDEFSPVYIPAWEGGHHDHDGLHAVAALLLFERGMLGRAYQFPLYHANGCIGPFFRVLTPLAGNGDVLATPLRWRDRCRYVRHCLRYPSQAKSWLGLLPFVALCLMLRGRQTLQLVDAERVRHRPHPGRLYYEKREFLEYGALERAIAAWRPPA